MYASLPSADATISWGSGPAGTRATICKVAGSTIASELSLFSSTSNAGEGVCAAVKFAASRKTPNAPVRQIELRPEFIHRLIIPPLPHAKLPSKYYTLVAHHSCLCSFPWNGPPSEAGRSIFAHQFCLALSPTSHATTVSYNC